MAGILADQVCIFASPFRRTIETAQIVADVLDLASTKPSIKVRTIRVPVPYTCVDHTVLQQLTT